MSRTATPDPVAELRAVVAAGTRALRGEADGELEPTLERPRREGLGDYSTNAPMLLAPLLGGPPREIAERLVEELSGSLGADVEGIEVAGPGFVNLRLAEPWYRRGLAGILEAGDRFGAVGEPTGRRTLVEFVSANPTGPLTAAGGRHAAYGDALARLLAFAGDEVEREYYVNDVGGQVRRFAESIAARMTGEEPPEDGYQGPYVAALAEQLAQEGIEAGGLDRLEVRGTEVMLDQIRATLERFGVEFDRFASERQLHQSGGVEKALEELRERSPVYESEGAIWLKTSDFGDDKDRVLVRSGGEPTYFLADIAYHADKRRRGWERLIDVLGADHHGYVERMRAALQALGMEPDDFEALIMQLVHVVEGGARAQMSKRRGEFVTLDELIDDIGRDAARFFMLQRSHDTTVELDLELARRQSSENPVYYVQYAHARIASILRKAGESAADGARSAGLDEAAWPVEQAERTLLKRLLEFPGEASEAAARRAPHRLCAYGGAVAADFHAFYRDCQVVGASGEGVQEARLALCTATKQTIARTLDLLGITAPERM
jgi:arginyl-tRNA synthetase